MTAAITFSRQNNAGLENLLLVLVLVLESKGPYYDSEPRKNNTNERLGERKECLSTNVLQQTSRSVFPFATDLSVSDSRVCPSVILNSVTCKLNKT